MWGAYCFVPWLRGRCRRAREESRAESESRQNFSLLEDRRWRPRSRRRRPQRPPRLPQRPPRAPHHSMASSSSNFSFSNLLPSLQGFAKVGARPVSPRVSCTHLSSPFASSSRAPPPQLLDSRPSVRIPMTLSSAGHISRLHALRIGFGLLYYGQNYLIYPSAFPPGSRTGALLFLVKPTLGTRLIVSRRCANAGGFSPPIRRP